MGVDSIIATLCETKKARRDRLSKLNAALKHQNRQNALRRHSKKSKQKYANVECKDSDTEKELHECDVSQFGAVEAEERDLIDFYLCNDEEIELQTLRDNVVNFLFAGRDAMALFISWFLFEVTAERNRSVYE